MDDLSDLELHEATMDNAHTLWAWRNDPVTCANSRNTDPVPMDRHLEWLEKTIAREDVKLYLLRFKGTPLATIRFDYTEDDLPEFSWTLAPVRRGRGWGKIVARFIAGMEPHFFGEIRRENIAAQKACAAAGMIMVKDGEFQRWESHQTTPG